MNVRKWPEWADILTSANKRANKPAHVLWTVYSVTTRYCPCGEIILLMLWIWLCCVLPLGTVCLSCLASVFEEFQACPSSPGFQKLHSWMRANCYDFVVLSHKQATALHLYELYCLLGFNLTSDFMFSLTKSRLHLVVKCNPLRATDLYLATLWHPASNWWLLICC